MKHRDFFGRPWFVKWFQFEIQQICNNKIKVGKMSKKAAIEILPNLQASSGGVLDKESYPIKV